MSLSHKERHFQPRPNRIGKKRNNLNYLWVLGLGLGAFALLILLPVIIAFKGPPPNMARAESVAEATNVKNVLPVSTAAPAQKSRGLISRLETGVAEHGESREVPEPFVEMPDEVEPAASPNPVSVPPQECQPCKVLKLQVPDENGGTRVVVIDFDRKPEETVAMPTWPIFDLPEPAPIPTPTLVMKDPVKKQPNLVLFPGGGPNVVPPGPGSPPKMQIPYSPVPPYTFTPIVWSPPRIFIPWTTYYRPRMPIPNYGGGKQFCCPPHRGGAGFNTFMTFAKGHCCK